MKDNFSRLSDRYRKFRPLYPPAFYSFLLSHVPSRNRAWDCGTGNGQVATGLAQYFTHVVATDISPQQIALAPRHEKITFSPGRAEECGFADRSFDLITAGQAAHWFEFPQFFGECRRTLVPGGLVALFGYDRPKIGKEADTILDYFYGDVLNGYWDSERHFVEERYSTIPFPFREIDAPLFATEYGWTVDDCLGYLSTWSATQHYTDRNGRSPVDLIENKLRAVWNAGEKKTARFEIFCRAGVTD